MKRDLLLDELKAVGQQLRRVEAELDRISQRHDPDRKKIAIVATAHYLARVM